MPVKHFDDFDALAHSNRDVLDLDLRIDVQAMFLRQLADAVGHDLAVQDESFGRLIP